MATTRSSLECHAPTPFASLEALEFPDDILTSVKKLSSYGWFGAFDTESLAESASKYIASNSEAGASAGRGSERELKLKASLRAFLDLVARDAAAITPPAARPTATQACWLTVRMFKPTSEYVTPRWHRDGRMFPCSCTAGQDADAVANIDKDGERIRPARHHAKYAVTLLGPPTRLMRPGTVVDEVLASYEHANADKTRAEVAARLREEGGAEELVLPSARQVVRFSWGQLDSPVHSEPDWSSTDRVFVSVLFGTETELRAMCGWRHEVYGVVTVQ